MHCSIIIPTRLRADLLLETLDSLNHQSEKDFEVVVVCDGEDPQTRDLSIQYEAKFPLRWVFNAENVGQASARNTGAQVATGNLLLFLDDDTAPAPDWLSHHRKRHESRGHNCEVVVLGQLQHIYAQPARSHTERFLRRDIDDTFAKLYSVLMEGGKKAAGHVWVGLNTSICRTRYLAAGGGDAKLPHVQEDAELGTRLWSEGIEFIFEPRALIYHRSTKDLIDAHYRNAPLFGQSDVYRVRDKRQHIAQDLFLSSIHRGKLKRRLRRRMAWEYPRLMCTIGELCRPVTDAVGSEFFFRVWADLTFSAGYWEGVKSEGVTLDSLQRLIA